MILDPAFFKRDFLFINLQSKVLVSEVNFNLTHKSHEFLFDWHSTYKNMLVLKALTFIILKI